jgi:probable HAF family extracellular repeat protein
VVGYGETTGSVDHAWLWQTVNGVGVMTDLNTLIPPNSGWVLNDAYGINDNQQIVGRGHLGSGGVVHAFLWQIGGGVPTDLGVLKGGTESYANAINANGQVAGAAREAIKHSNTWQPFLWTSPGPMNDLGTLKDATATYAYALNNLSSVQVVGTSGQAPPGDAVLWQNGQVIDLNTQIPSNSGWTVLQTAYGINESGQIVGYGQLSSGADHAFLLTPATTPATPLAATSPATSSTFSVMAAPSAGTVRNSVVIGLPATSPLTQGPALAPAPIFDAAHSSGPPSSMPTIGQALSSPGQAQSAQHIVFAEAEDDDGVFGDHDVRFVSSSPDFKN